MELWLLRMSASKPSMSTLLARDGRKLTGDDHKLQCWVEHFSDVVNSETEVSMATLDALPVIEPPSALNDGVCVCMHVCIYVCMRASMCVCACDACMHACVCV